jgi:hypothetical protein
MYRGKKEKQEKEGEKGKRDEFELRVVLAASRILPVDDGIDNVLEAGHLLAFDDCIQVTRHQTEEGVAWALSMVRTEVVHSAVLSKAERRSRSLSCQPVMKRKMWKD